MKTKLLGYFAAAALALSAIPAQAANVSVGVFYDSLEPHGEWFETPEYGYVWHPRGVDENWRPYTVGNWAYTDAGWTWVSDEPFGWATYHYGRWVEIERVGWTWVPDREWGPAWVSWRRSDRHVGWAPLPPEARFEARIGFSNWVDSYYDIGPTYYSFVSVRDFGSPRLRTVILEPRENITIIRETRNITNITYQNNVIINQGPEYDVIVRESAQPIRRLKLERRTDIDFRRDGDRNRFAAQVSGDTLRVAAPEVEVSRDVKPAKLGRKLDRVEVDRGWKRAGDAQAVEQFRTSVAAESKAPAELPAEPKLAGSDRKARGDRQTDTTAAPAAAPGATPTAESSTREMKPGTEKPAAETTAKTKAERDKMKSQPTAETQPKTETPAPTTTAETSPAKKDKEKARSSGVAETTPTDEKEKSKKTTAREQPEKKETPDPVAVRPNERTERPNAAAAAERERMQRPESRGNEQTQTPAARPDEEKAKKRNIPAPENPAAEVERKRTERPEAERPGRNQRPESAVERPERNERQAPPQQSAEEREPKRKGPPAAEDRSPDRARPEAAERSPERRPPAPEAREQGAAKKAGKQEQGGEVGREKKDDKKKD